MEYRIEEWDGELFLRCLEKEGGPVRKIRHSKGVPTMVMLDRLWGDGHATYSLLYRGSEIGSKEWDDLLEDVDSDLDDVEVRVHSDLDPLHLAGMCWLVCEYGIRRGGRRKVTTRKYKIPTSKKQGRDWREQPEGKVPEAQEDAL